MKNNPFSQFITTSSNSRISYLLRWLSTASTNTANSVTSPLKQQQHQQQKKMSESNFTTNVEDMKVAAEMRKGKTTETDASGESHSATSLSVAVEKVKLPPFCEIDEDATQKYVLVSVTVGKQTHFFVRGKESASYHKDAAKPLIYNLSGLKGVEYGLLYFLFDIAK